MKVRDLQFPRYFLTNEIDLHPSKIREILDRDIEVRLDGEPDTVTDRENVLIIHNPSSLTRFIFNVLYTTLSKYIVKDIYRDKLGLGLLYMCKNYVYADFDPKDAEGPPVLVDFNKVPVPAFVIHELIEPIIGTIETRPIFFIPCKFTDTCREIKSADHLAKQYNLPRTAVNYSDFPVLLCNCNVYNSPAVNSHLIVKTISLALGEEKASKVIRSIFLDESGHSMSHLILILKTLRGEPDFVLEFLRYFGSNITLTDDEKHTADEIQTRSIAADSFMGVKTARDTQITKQWSQWSMLMGLIEKQLTPMRGSMWPVSTTVKPHEDELRARQKEMAEKKGKNQLNFEELLDSYRSVFDHKAVEPGKVMEHMLKDNRVWK